MYSKPVYLNGKIHPHEVPSNARGFEEQEIDFECPTESKVADILVKNLAFYKITKILVIIFTVNDIHIGKKCCKCLTLLQYDRNFSYFVLLF